VTNVAQPVDILESLARYQICPGVRAWTDSGGAPWLSWRPLPS
jgi:hypothetical protein